ncbi:DUF7144 family membrane protein [Saccharopolyspora sp. NPDC000995]
MTTHGARRMHTGWVGWVYFAAVVLLLAGIVQVINGLIAFARSGTTYVIPAGAVQISYAGVGWSFLITGAVLVLTGIGLFGGRTWARAVAIVMAVISVLANLAFFTAYPLWSAVVIVLDVIVIYALAAHGREVSRR